MGRMILKERVFSPTGRTLGSFSAVDLEPFDLQYTESDAPSPEEGQQGSGGRKRVPDPVDNDPLKPITSPDSSNNKSGVDPFKQNNQGDGEGSPPDKWDIEGNDIDDEEQMGQLPEPPAESLGGGGQGDGEAPDSDEDWGGGGSEDNTPQRGQNGGNQGGQQGNPQGGDGDGGSEGEPGEDGGDQGGQGGSSSGGEGSNGQGDQDGGGQDSDQGGQDGNQGQNGNQPGGQGGQGSQGEQGSPGGPAPGGYSESEDGYGENRETISKMLEDDMAEDEDEDSSDMANALKRMDSERSEVAKAKEAVDQEIAKEEKEKKRQPMSKEEAQAAKDIVSDAVKRSKEEKLRRTQQGIKGNRSGDDAGGYEDVEDAILSALGAGAMTSLFNPAMKSDWRAQLDKVFDQATGMEIITNPNLINKKIENAPPGREDDLPAIDKILVLLDCSGSMGYDAFKQVVAHVDTMLKVRKMNNTTFHIICWGDGSVKAVCDTHMKVKGKAFKKTMMGLHAKSWGTAIGPAFKAASQLVKQPDAILVFTDMGIGDSYSNTDPIVSKYMKKNKKKIIYILTHDASMGQLKAFDPYAYNKKQWIKFKNDRER